MNIVRLLWYIAFFIVLSEFLIAPHDEADEESSTSPTWIRGDRPISTIMQEESENKEENGTPRFQVNNTININRWSNEEEYGVKKDFIYCIWHHGYLISYISKKKHLQEQFLQAFGYGKNANKFVKITFSYYISNDSEKRSQHNETCFSNQATYIWSESALYFLGPKSLYWLTLFIVSVSETSTMVELPVCLCHDESDRLLSKLLTVLTQKVHIIIVSCTNAMITNSNLISTVGS